MAAEASYQRGRVSVYGRRRNAISIIVLRKLAVFYYVYAIFFFLEKYIINYTDITRALTCTPDL